MKKLVNWLKSLHKDVNMGKKILPEYVATKSGYKGLLVIRCPDCGEQKVIRADIPMSWHGCRNCGEYIPLEKMRRVYLNGCPCCGSSTRYLTNVPGDYLEVCCRKCKAPVDHFWSDKHKAFVSV